MEKANLRLRVFFFPFMDHGHMIPIIDMAKLFAGHDVESTIVTTPVNAALLSKSLAQTKPKIHIKTIPFPVVEAGLPEGCENVGLLNSHLQLFKFFDCCSMLREPLEQLLNEHRPDCLIADMFFPWATDSAGKFNIPRIVFHGTSAFTLCASEVVRLYKPHTFVSTDEEPFLIPYLPDEIKLTKRQLPGYSKLAVENSLTKLIAEAQESELKSYGVITNTFCELEPAYVDFYRRFLGRKSWNVGPVSLCNGDDAEEKTPRGKESAIDENVCLKWLNSKKANSVVYVCFGSTSKFPACQLQQVALALEASEQDFIWVVQRGKEDGANTKEDYLPAGFAERILDRGMIIRGWAPQVLILDHEAIGGFVTHCGWNSTLEGISAGVPMVTWPVSAEQFFNEKLVTSVLRIGFGVGSGQCVGPVGECVKKEAIEKAIKRVLAGEEAEDMRRRAKALGKMARKAVGEEGSSSSDLKALIQGLRKR